MERLKDSQVTEPERLSLTFLNSHKGSGFTAIQNIKRPAKNSIPDHHRCVRVSKPVCVVCQFLTCACRQMVSWIDEEHTSLEVHVGSRRLERIIVSHAILRSMFENMVKDIRADLSEIGVPSMDVSQFHALKDSSTSTHPGEGMGTYNITWNHAAFVEGHKDEAYRIKFMTKAHRIYRLTMAVIHICGGPAPRATEEAVTRLLNSDTEAMRNVQLIRGTIGIEKG